MDAALATQLVSARGLDLLAQLPEYDEKQVVKVTMRLRNQGYEPDLIAAALTQSRLRQRAASKLGERATSMLFTQDALEQATRLEIARRHAARLTDAGLTHVVDAGCGIGSDAVVFAESGLEVDAVELDESTAVLARHNLAGFAQVRVHVTDATTFRAPADSAWWFDPARRVSGVADITGKTKRTFSLEALSPSWETVRRRCETAPAGGAKLSPSLRHADIPPGCEAEFVSYAGEVVETTLWWGRAVNTPGRTATIVDAHGGVIHAREVDAEPCPLVRSTEEIGRYLYEADKALTRSGLVGALSVKTSGAETDAGYGYVTSDALMDVGLLAKRYEVLDVVSLNPKVLRPYLRERGIGNLTIKKRGVDIDPATLRKSLKLKGCGHMTIALTHVAGTVVGLVVQPLEAGSNR